MRIKFCPSLMIGLLVAVACFTPAIVYGADAGRADVTAIRLGRHNSDHFRLVLDMSKSADYHVFTLANPYRLVLDLPEVAWPQGRVEVPKDGLVSGIRYGLFAPRQSRLVLDLIGPIQVVEDFLIPPSAGFGHRLVVDLNRVSVAKFKQLRSAREKRVVVVKDASPAIGAPQGSFVPSPDQLPVVRPDVDRSMIVIDPGHGGVDPGAKGKRVQEKKVVFSYAKELARALRKTGKYRIHMTRNRDIYVPLATRVEIARQRNADLFISIHADAIKHKNVRGLSIYTLSEKASDGVAAALARKENQSDIIAGIDFEDQPREVTNILIDLVQRETKNLSTRFANLMIQNAKAATRTLERPHRYAGFRVLKAPDVPSVLIELGFLTNPRDENQLISKSWRRKVVKAMVKAINSYFNQYAVANL